MRYLNFIILTVIFGMSGCGYNKNTSESIKTSSVGAVKAEFRINVNFADKGYTCVVFDPWPDARKAFADKIPNDLNDQVL